MAWNPQAHSLAAAIRSSDSGGVTRRYVPDDPAAPLPSNDSANAGAVQRRPGEHVAGWQPDDISEADMTGEPRCADRYTHSGGRITRAERGGNLAAWLADELDGNTAAAAPRTGAPPRRTGMAGASGAAAAKAQLYGAQCDEEDLSAASTAAAMRPPPVGAVRAAVPPSPSMVSTDMYQRALWTTEGSRTPLQGLAAVTANEVRPWRDGFEVGGGTRGAPPLSDWDLRAAANGATLPGAAEGDLAMGVPRRQDLGLAVAGIADSRDWRGFVATGPQDGPSLPRVGNAMSMDGGANGGGVRASLVREAPWPSADGGMTRVDPAFADGRFGVGQLVDAVFSGVWVDPLTGVEYDTYENAAPPPTGDYRVKDSAQARRFDDLHGGWAPGRPRPHRVEVVNEDDAAPDADDRDWIEYARARAGETAARYDFFGPHEDDAAWTDGEGYKSLPSKELPTNKIGLVDAVRFTPFPALHLHADLRALPATGNGIAPGEGGFAAANGGTRPDGIARLRIDAAGPSRSGVDGAAAGAYGAAYRPEIAHTPLRTSAAAPLLLSAGGGIAGWAAAADGSGTGGMIDWAAPLSQRDATALALGTAAMGAVQGTAAGAEGSGTGGMATWEEPMSTRHLTALALGRRLLAAVDGAAAAAEAAPVGWAPQGQADAWGTRIDEPLRTPAFVRALGMAVLDGLATAPSAPGMPPVQPHAVLAARGDADLTMAIGSRIAGLLAAVEGSGTGGMMEHAAPLRLSDTYAAALAATLDSAAAVGAASDVEAAGAAALMQFAVQSRALHETVNNRGTADLRFTSNDPTGMTLGRGEYEAFNKGWLNTRVGTPAPQPGASSERGESWMHAMRRGVPQVAVYTANDNLTVGAAPVRDNAYTDYASGRYENDVPA